MVKVEQLKKLKIFREAPEASLAYLGEGMNEKTYHKNDVVCREGEAEAVLYVIVSGQVAVEKKLSQGEMGSKVVARLGAEEFVGEMAFLFDQPHSATVIAEDETKLFLLPRATLDELIKKDSNAALNQILTLLAGQSSRLRATTRELVTVYETARLVGQSLPVKDLSEKLVQQLAANLGGHTSVALYQWNQFNDEYALLLSEGINKDQYPPVIEKATPLLSRNDTFCSLPDLERLQDLIEPIRFGKGHLIVSRVDSNNVREGLFLYYNETPGAFEAGERQMMETISSVLAPAFSSARLRDEEESRVKYERNKQARYRV